MSSLAERDRVTCAQCGAIAPLGSRFCQSCGSTLSGSAEHELDADVRNASEAAAQEVLERLRRATHGRYEVQRELGRGGMASVHLAYERKLDRHVAIKVMRPSFMDDEELVRRFAKEARTVAALQHPHIIHIHAVEQREQLYYYVMEYVAGRSLDDVQRDVGRLPIAAVQAIAYQVADALDYAHGRGVIHRDVKPANILLSESGSAIVTDFGIAKRKEGTHTLPSMLMGTPTYMSPEQFLGAAITAASDQYSLGVALYVLLTGKAPFAHGDMLRQMQAVLSAPPPGVSSIRDDVPAEVDEALLRMLAKEPAERWASCSAAADAFGAVNLRSAHSVRVYLGDLACRRTPLDVPVGTLTPPSNLRDWKTPVPNLGGATPVPAVPRDPTPVPVALVAIEPPGRALHPGQTLRLRLVATGADGEPLVGRPALWSATGAALSISSGGVVTALAVGVGRVSATCEGISASVEVVVQQAPIVSLSIEYDGLLLEVGDTTQLEIQALDATGHSLTGRKAAWTVDRPDVLRVTATGEAQARSPGLAMVSVACEGITASRRLSVAPARVHSLHIDDAGDAVVAESAVALAVRLFDKRQRPITARPLQWRVNRPDVANVDGAGVLSLRAPGPLVVSATCDGIMGSLELTVEPAPVATLEIRLPATTLRERATMTCVAVPRSAAGTILADRRVSWSSSDQSILTITASGRATARAAGVVTLAASCDGVQARTSIAVEALPPSPPLFERPHVRRAAGTLGALCILAIIGLAGRALANRPTTPAPDATGVVRTPTVSVPPRIARLDFAPAVRTVRAGSQVALSAVARDSLGGVMEAVVDWTVSDSRVARLVDGSTLAFLAPGAVTVVASVGEVEARSDFTVVDSAATVAPAVLARLVPRPTTVSLGVGDTADVSVSGVDAAGVLLPEAAFVWASADPAVASVSRSGRIVGTGVGRTVVRVRSGPIDATISVTVVPAVSSRVIAQLRVSPDTGTLLVGQSLTLRLSAVDARGAALAAEDVEWIADPAARAAVSPDGRVTAVAPGPVRVIATSQGQRAMADLVVRVAETTAVPVDAKGATAAAEKGEGAAAGGEGTVARGLQAGGTLSCARFEGDRGLRCWGRGQSAPFVAADLGGLSIGGAHACGIARGTVQCWGRNGDGQLGGSAAGASLREVPLPGAIPARLVVTGGTHSCALAEDGSAFCWGNNRFGQLGDGTTKGRAEPQPVRGGLRFRSLAAGGAHTCGITVSGGLACWGDDFSGAVGGGRNEAETEPVEVDRGKFGFVSVYAGGKHTCALTVSGEAYCGGENLFGQAGVGGRSDRSRLGRRVQRDVRFTSLSLGERHTCGVTSDGGLFCWGDNAFGQLGNGTSGEKGGRNAPTEVQSDVKFESVRAGSFHTCALARGGAPFCWGDNSRGQLAMGSEARMLVPTPLRGVRGGS